MASDLILSKEGTGFRHTAGHDKESWSLKLKQYAARLFVKEGDVGDGRNREKKHLMVLCLARQI